MNLRLGSVPRWAGLLGYLGRVSDLLLLDRLLLHLLLNLLLWLLLDLLLRSNEGLLLWLLLYLRLHLNLRLLLYLDLRLLLLYLRLLLHLRLLLNLLLVRVYPRLLGGRGCPLFLGLLLDLGLLNLGLLYLGLRLLYLGAEARWRLLLYLGRLLLYLGLCLGLGSAEACWWLLGCTTAEACRGLARRWCGGCYGNVLARHINLFVDIAVRGDVVARFVLTLGRFQLDTHLQWDAVQLLAVLHLQNTDRVRQGGQLLVGNFLGYRVGVLDVEAGEDFAVGKLAFDHGEDTGQSCALAVGRRLDFGLGQHYSIPAWRQRVAGAGIRCHGSCVKIQKCHVIPLRSFSGR